PSPVGNNLAPWGYSPGMRQLGHFHDARFLRGPVAPDQAAGNGSRRQQQDETDQRKTLALRQVGWQCRNANISAGQRKLGRFGSSRLLLLNILRLAEQRGLLKVYRRDEPVPLLGYRLHKPG